MKLLKEALRESWFIIAVLVLCILKYLIASSLPVFARDAGGPDQFKLLVDAENIFNGEYMNHNIYDMFALFKRAISFPIFLACCHWLGISYMSGYTLLYIFSCLLALFALMQVSRNKAMLIISFAIILFSPFSYDNIVQMIYNLSFTAPLAIAAISCLFIIYNKRNKSNWEILGWSLLASINLMAIWLNREDSMWIIPLIGCFILVVGVCELKNKNRKRVVIRLIIFSLPIITVILSDIALSYVNYKKFGIYTTNDYTATNFEKAYNSILRVEQDYFPEKCSITKGTLEKIYVASPAMNELKPYMDEFYEQGSYDRDKAADDGEIEDGWMNIALRDAASRCGYYRDAITANEYWGKVTEEMEIAFENGLLQSRNMVFFGSTLHHPWRSGDGYAAKWLKAACELLLGDIKHTLGSPKLEYNCGGGIKDRYEAMTLNYSVDPPEYIVTILGWLYFIDDTEDYTLQLVDQNGEMICDLEWLESPDISNDLSDRKSKCRFSVKAEVDQDTQVSIRVNGANGYYQDIVCSNDQVYEGIAYYFDVVDKEYCADANEAYAIQRIQIATALAKIYKVIGPILALWFAVGYIYKTFRLLYSWKNKNYEYFDAWLLQSAILESILIFLAAISYVHAFMWGALFYTHTMAVLLDFAGATAVVLDGDIIYKKIKKKHT